jgi:DNA repair exonuclease SbcCD nuclease subunit
LPYRILHCADLHLDRAFASIGCYGDLARRRRQGLREALQRIGAEAQRRQCDAVTIAGDLYEQERADPETGRFLAETFASWQPLRVVLAPGNHDPLQPGSLYARADWPDNVHLFTETALRPLALDDGLTLWGLAHRDPAWGGDPLVCSPVGDDGGVHLALFHGAELGSRPEGKSVHGPFRASRIADRGFSLALSGHYHRRRVDLGARLLYPGSPEPLSFEEDGGRGPVLVEIDGNGRVRCEPLQLNAWTALVVDCRLDEVESSSTAIQRVRETARAACASSDPERLMLRVDVRGEVPADVAVDVPLLEGVVTEATRAAVVRVRDLSIPAVDVAAALADRTTRGAFTREVLAMLDNATDPGERAVLGDALRYGLQALSGVEVGLR